MGCSFRGTFNRKQISPECLVLQGIPAILFYLNCFLMKIAIAVALKKSRNKNCFLKRNLLIGTVLLTFI